jgi:hypothetical protein
LKKALPGEGFAQKSPPTKDFGGRSRENFDESGCAHIGDSCKTLSMSNRHICKQQNSCGNASFAEVSVWINLKTEYPPGGNDEA